MSRELVPEELVQQAIAWRRHLHMHPELSFQETETSAFVAQTLSGMDGLEITRPTPTSVVARLRGARPGKVLALRADMDALPIGEETGLPYASTRPGVMHACGHDAHTAILLAAASALAQRREQLAGEVRFLFQHAEEVPPGGARELVRAGVLEGVDTVVGIHLFAQEPLGIVSVPAGPRLAAADTFAIEVRGAGGHGGMPHTAVNPVAVAAEVVTNLQHLVATRVDPLESAVLSVTCFNGGTADNVIPETAELRGTMRTFDPAVRAALHAALERVAAGVTQAHGATYRLDVQKGYSPLINDPQAAALVEAAARAELGDAAIQPTPPLMGSEDFSAYLEAVPGAFFIVGAGAKERPPHHHPRFVIDEEAFRPGIAVFVRTALNYLAIADS
jgi:amidohydrolase